MTIYKIFLFYMTIYIYIYICIYIYIHTYIHIGNGSLHRRVSDGRSVRGLWTDVTYQLPGSSLQRLIFAKEQFCKNIMGRSFELTSHTNFQYYPPSGGYKTYHTERTVRYREFFVFAKQLYERPVPNR